MKKILILCFVVLATTSFAQSNYYYYKGKQKPLTIDKSKVNVFTTTTFQKSSVNNLNAKDFDLQNTSIETEKGATIDFGNQLNEIEFMQKVNALRNNPSVVGIGYHYKAVGETVGTSNIFYIKLKNTNDIELLQKQATLKNAVVLRPVDFDPLWYCLKTTKQNTGTALETANQFFETGLFAEIDPCFMLRFENASLLPATAPVAEATATGCANDTYFGNQWGLNNTINPAIDINACQAWGIAGATGANVRVGVVDTGIKLNHPDLNTNLFHRSYNSDAQTEPSILNNDYAFPPYINSIGVLTFNKSNHGTHVAGIIGAVKFHKVVV